MDKVFQKFIQVAGVLDADDLSNLFNVGVRYVGFPLRLGYHNPDLTEEAAADLIKTFPDNVTPILITYEENVTNLVALCQKLNVSTVQIHGDMDYTEVAALRKTCPDLILIKSLIVGRFTDIELFKQIDLYSNSVDAFITDTFDPLTGACGATGKMHNLEITKAIASYSEKPVILAGGLNADNVYDAICQTGVLAVDVHTGVEDANGKKNPLLVTQFISEAKRGFAEVLK